MTGTIAGTVTDARGAISPAGAVNSLPYDHRIDGADTVDRGSTSTRASRRIRLTLKLRF